MPRLHALRVFVKAPRIGEVKTRLAAGIGSARAARLYQALAEAEVAATAPRPLDDYEQTLCFAPAEAGGEIGAWFPGRPREPQQGLDLGARMSHAFDTAFQGGARRVALIGTDAPGVTRSHILRTYRDLETADLVVGPAADGGYYLIGMKQKCPGLFAGIPWSTPQVLGSTLRRATELGLRTLLLEELRDIDTLEDVRACWTQLKPILRAFRGRRSPAAKTRLAMIEDADP